MILDKIGFITLGLIICLFVSCSNDKDNHSDDPYVNVTTDPIAAGNGASTLELPIKANGPWQTKTDADWITVSPSWGINKGAITITISKNRTTESREGTITIWIDEEHTQSITVNQAAGEELPYGSRHFFVTTSGSTDNSGYYWEEPTTLEEALTEAVDGETIHIAAGTYVPGKHLSGADGTIDGDKTFEIKANISLIGGYPADASDGAVSDPATNATVLSGKMEAGNVFHVVSVTASVVAEKKVTLRGLKIQEGIASSLQTSVTVNGADYNRNCGGGIIAAKSALAIKNCEVSNNETVSNGSGAGIYVREGATVTIDSCVIKDNTGRIENCSGTGLWNRGCTVYINNTTFSNNRAGGNGGAILAHGDGLATKTYVYNTTFSDNLTGLINWGSRPGGAYYGRTGSEGIMLNCTFYKNTATIGAPGASSSDGGAISLHGGAKLDLVSCTLTQNIAGRDAGAIIINDGCYLNIYNSVVSGNVARRNNNEIMGAYTILKSSIISDKVFDNGGAEVSGQAFDPALMLGTLANNGGLTQTITLTGSGNPATIYGMNADELQSLGASLSPAVENAVISADQRGQSRSEKNMGAWSN